MSRHWRWLRVLGWVPAAALMLGIAVLAAAGLVLGTASGTQWLWQVARDFAPGTLEAANLSGRLGGVLDIRGLHYRDGDLELKVARLHLDWRPAALLQGRLHLRELSIESPHLRLPPTSGGSSGGRFPGLLLPISVNLDQLRVDDLQLAPDPTAAAVVLDHLALAAKARGQRVEITRLDASAYAANLHAHGHLGLEAGLPLVLDLAWNYRVPDGPRLAGSGRAVGDLKRLLLTQALQPPVAGSLRASLLDLETAPHWNLRLDLEDLDLGSLAPAFPGHLRGRLGSTGNPDNVDLDGALDLQQAQLGAVSTRIEVHFDGKQLSLRTLKATTPAGSTISARGRFDLGGGPRSLALSLDWDGLRWPLAGTAVQVQSSDGHLSVDGSLQDYGYRLQGKVQVPGQPDLELDAKGRGGPNALDLEPLLARLPQGRLEARGRVAWSPQPRWQLAVQGQGLDPALLQPDFPGRLDLALDSEGRVADGTPSLRLDLKRLQGTLRDLPVRGSGRLRMDGGELALEGVTLRSGKAQVQADGSLGHHWALSWSLDAPHLGDLWPGLAGTLQGKGRLDGTAEAPRVRADLSGHGLRYRGYAVKTLTAKADLALAPNGSLSLALEAGDLEAGPDRWPVLTVAADGTRAQHRLRLTLRGRDTPGLDLAADGSLEADDTWSGSLRKLDLDLPRAGVWSLAQAADLRLGAKAQTLDRLCLKGAAGQVCARYQSQPGGGWSANVEAPQLTLAALQPLLPDGVQLSGQGGLKAAFNADAAGRIRGKAHLGLPKGRMRLQVADQPQDVDFSGAGVDARLDAKGAKATLHVPLGALGDISGELRLPGLDAAHLDPARQPMQGRVQAGIGKLDFVSALVPRVADVHGRVDADLTLGGRLAAPRIQGHATLADGALDVPVLGLKVRDLGLKLTAPDLDRVAFQGEAQSGGGRLEVQGETRLDPAHGFPTRLKLRGSDWVAVDVPEATVQVSPDLSLDYDAERTLLEGEVRIPFARIRPRELPATAVANSPDLVVVGRDAPPPAEDSHFHAKLRIIFGDRVSFEGFGLRGRLSGDLQVIDEPGRPVLGRGQVGIVDGTYRAYGQDLTIQRGNALFADGPVDNPGLDVQAVRTVGDITAGLRVTGTLKKPKLNLFSTPPMTQSETLSYLLTGSPSGQAGGGGSTAVTAALAASGAASVTGEIGRRLGLDELRVDTGNSLNNASLMAGTWLSPRLYVQYVNDLANRNSKLRFRYDLTKRLQVQTETGAAQGVDLYYTFER